MHQELDRLELAWWWDESEFSKLSYVERCIKHCFTTMSPNKYGSVVSFLTLRLKPMQNNVCKG